MSKGLHRIEDVDSTGVEFSEPIRRFFHDNELKDCIFANSEGEIGMIAVDRIVLDDLKKMVNWDLEHKASALSRFKERVEKDLEDESLVHYRVY